MDLDLASFEAMTPDSSALEECDFLTGKITNVLTGQRPVNHWVDKICEK
jgi:hypothetical protein